MSESLLSRAFMSITQAIDDVIGWHRLPSLLGIPTLLGVRNRLRQFNLFDRGEYRLPPDEKPGEWEHWRHIKGRFNDLESPLMGSVGSRFGRNVPLDCTQPENPPGILLPDPFEVSSRLLARERFVAAELNVLTAAWIQFEVHDWFDHGKAKEWDAESDVWDPGRPDWPEGRMPIKRTRPEDPRHGGRIGSSPAFTSEDTHWWDGSQIYGRDEVWLGAVRAEDGRLKSPDELLGGLGELVDPAGTAANLWVGSLALCALFALEHNAICDALTKHERRRRWSSDELFHTARLVNAALMAKIHTLDWTPAILDHPTLRRGMRINWWGALEPITKRWGRLGKSAFLFGFPGSPTNHHGSPYCLTEEFVAVYRMHWLMPDEYSFVSAGGRRRLSEFQLLDLVGPAKTASAMEQIGDWSDALYSLGIARAGAPGLHNYPTSLRDLVRAVDRAGNVERMDLAAVDVLRDRERGVPRYNLFRQLFHMRPVQTFDQLTNNPKWADEIRSVYENDIDRVDLQVGLLAEPPPRGFVIGDTAFRVFLLMASRRFESDRFLTAYYNTDTYTATGLDWIKANDFKSVLLRHFEGLEPALRGVKNPFLPWSLVGH